MRRRRAVARVDTPEMQLVLQGCNTTHTQRKRRLALRDFMTWHGANYGKGVSVLSPDRLNRAIVNAYIAYLRDEVQLTPSNINARLTAIKMLAREAAANGLLDEKIAVGVTEIKGIPERGRKLGNWLTQEQAERLILLPDMHTMKGVRDRALLTVLLGTALRRFEVSKLTFEQIQQREGRWVIVDLVGKHHHVRTVPMPSWTKVAIDRWSARSGLTTGHVFRALRRGTGRIDGDRLSAQAIYDVVKDYVAQMRLSGAIAPHDMRRTAALLARKGGASLEQIQLWLGHQSITTTERYVPVTQDLTDAPCDHLGLRIVG